MDILLFERSSFSIFENIYKDIKEKIIISSMDKFYNKYLEENKNN